MEHQEILYSIDAHIYPEAKKAAQEFARSYWSEPRRIRWNGGPRGGTFVMIGGRRRYAIKLTPGKLAGGFDRMMLWVITVQEENAA